mgnify:CR=1 FL=1
MKRILSILLCLAMLLTLSVGAMAETFEGTGKGFGGDIKVKVTMDGTGVSAECSRERGEIPAYDKFDKAFHIVH